MKAIFLDHPCSAEEMRISEIPVPEVRPGWVLVKIQAIGLNHSEALLRMFEPAESHRGGCLRPR